MSGGLTVVDGHVHVYECFDVSRLLGSAYTNLRAAARREAGAHPFTGVLMLTESSGCDWFARTRAAVAERRTEHLATGAWSIEVLPGDACAVRATAEDTGTLLIVAGFQAVTEEGLEVLALATDSRPPDGQPAEGTVAAIVESGAVPVLPWGAGKWLGRRGKCVERLLGFTSRVLVADNAGRPWFWPRGGLFYLAASRGRPAISGSDPLPLPNEERSVGRAGFIVDADLSADSPSRDLKDLLLSGAVRAFGGTESASRFFRNQIRLRLESSPDGSDGDARNA